LSPFLSSAFDKLSPQAVIFDRLGNAVIATDKDMKFEPAGDHYALIWNGCNQRGRKVGTGTYRILVTINDQDGGKKTIGNMVYIIRRK